jgi:hypothetical protein
MHINSGAYLVFIGCLLIGVAFAVGSRMAKHIPYRDVPSQTSASKKVDDLNVVKRLKAERIVAVHRWHVENEEEKSLLCVFQAFDKDPHYEGNGIKLSILEPSGASVYEAYFSELQSVYSTSALRNLSDQLVVEVGYGGSTSFLHMLDYRNGKVVELIDKKESEFDVGAEVRPQFRSGVSPATEPFQIMLTQGVGLASPARKSTAVYRYKNGRYRRTGEFPQQDADDYIENLIKSPKE